MNRLPARVSGDARVARLLRDWYAPPGDAYWGTLEEKILATIAAAHREERAWALSLEPWVRVGLAAAGIAIAAASLVLLETRGTDAHAVYEAVIVTPQSYAAAVATAGAGARGREATLEYVISH
ncbi:MAG: hypothetical protein NVS1B4_19210 [Gemmatimonadaceae bacterium]